MKKNIIGYLVVFISFVILYKIYNDSEYNNLTCILSTVDGNKYCVRERKQMKKASDKLANVTKSMTQLVNHLGKKYPDKVMITRLVKGFNPDNIKETLPTSEYTAYSENKGEKIAFCLSKDKTNDNLIDDNTLLFVGLHELSHVSCKSVGHTKEFWSNFKFLLKEAVELNIYKPVDYKVNNVDYCGTKIKSNPYYD